MKDSFARGLEAELPRLRRYARALTRDVSRADDLVQDCLIRAIDKRHLWQEGTDLRAWLFTILHNLHINAVRNSVRKGRSIWLSEVEPICTIPPRALDSLELRDVERGLQKLPEEQRQVILLIGVEGLQYEEVAQVLDVPVGTVRSRVSRGRQALRELMEEKELRTEQAPAVLESKKTEPMTRSVDTQRLTTETLTRVNGNAKIWHRNDPSARTPSTFSVLPELETAEYVVPVEKTAPFQLSAAVDPDVPKSVEVQTTAHDQVSEPSRFLESVNKIGAIKAYLQGLRTKRERADEILEECRRIAAQIDTLHERDDMLVREMQSLRPELDDPQTLQVEVLYQEILQQFQPTV